MSHQQVHWAEENEEPFLESKSPLNRNKTIFPDRLHTFFDASERRTSAGVTCLRWRSEPLTRALVMTRQLIFWEEPAGQSENDRVAAAVIRAGGEAAAWENPEGVWGWGVGG